MNFDAAVSFLLKSLPPGDEPDVPAIAAKLGQSPHAVATALDRLITAKAKAQADQRARADRQAKESRRLRDAKKAARLQRPNSTDASLLAEASKHPAGAILSRQDLARAIGRHPVTVSAAAKRLKSAGNWKWTLSDGHPVVRARLHDHKYRPNPAQHPQRKTPRIGSDYRVRPPAPGSVNLSRCVLLHGPSCLSRPADAETARAARAYCERLARIRRLAEARLAEKGGTRWA